MELQGKAIGSGKKRSLIMDDLIVRCHHDVPLDACLKCENEVLKKHLNRARKWNRTLAKMVRSLESKASSQSRYQ